MIVSAADVPVVVPNPSNAYFAELSSVAATPDGKTLLVTWSSFDESAVVQGHIVVAHRANGGITTSAPADAPTGGQAAFDGTDFLVVGRANGPVIPGKPSSIWLQRFGLDGRAEQGPTTIASTPDVAGVSSAAWTSGGLAVAWSSASGRDAVARVQLVAPDGTIRHDLAVDAEVVDPMTGLESFDPAAVATFGGQLVAARAHTVSTLNWLGAGAQTSQTQFVVSVPVRSFPTVFETGGKLMVWGQVGGVLGPLGLYAGTPGGSFTLVRPVSPSAVTQQSDGCGGVVTLSNSNQTIEVAADAAPGGVVRLGTAIPDGANVAVMTPTPSGLTVAWVAADGIHLATLAWQ